MRRCHKRPPVGGSIVPVVAVAVLALLLHPIPDSVERSGILVDTVHRADFVRYVHEAGTLIPKEARSISAASAGRVERVLANAGDKVHADVVVLELSNPELVHLAREAESIRAQPPDSVHTKSK